MFAVIFLISNNKAKTQIQSGKALHIIIYETKNSEPTCMPFILDAGK